GANARGDQTGGHSAEQKKNRAHDIRDPAFRRLARPKWQLFAKDQDQRDITSGRDYSRENTESKVEGKRGQNDEEEITEHDCAGQRNIGPHDVPERSQKNRWETRFDGNVQVTGYRRQLSILAKISIKQLSHGPLVDNYGRHHEQGGIERRPRVRRGDVNGVDDTTDRQKRNADQRLQAGAFSFARQNLSAKLSFEYVRSRDCILELAHPTVLPRYRAPDESRPSKPFRVRARERPKSKDRILHQSRRDFRYAARHTETLPSYCYSNPPYLCYRS